MTPVSRYLLPAGFRPAGFVLLVAGCALAIVRFYFGLKPDWLDWHPFALFSSYLETKTLQVIGNNMSEEVSGLSLFLGLFFLTFSRFSSETEQKKQWRIRSFFLSVYILAGYVVLAFLLTYGFGFVYALMGLIYLPFICYLVVFGVLQGLYRLKRKNNSIKG